jgi:hypothetical protein
MIGAYKCTRCKKRFKSEVGLRQHCRRCVGLECFMALFPDSTAAANRRGRVYQMRRRGEYILDIYCPKKVRK